MDAVSSISAMKVETLQFNVSSAHKPRRGQVNLPFQLIVSCPDTSQNRVEHWERSFCAGHKATDLGHESDDAHLADPCRFTAHAAMTSMRKQTQHVENETVLLWASDD